MLRSIEQNAGGLSGVYMSGIYDDPSRSAVKRFQKSRGLFPNGVVDNATWDAITGEYSDILSRRETPARVSFFPNTDGYSLGIGDAGETVRVLQIILNELRQVYDGYDSIPIDGKYGKLTEDAVRAVQRANRINPDGRVNKSTWNKIVTDYNALADSDDN